MIGHSTCKSHSFAIALRPFNLRAVQVPCKWVRRTQSNSTKFEIHWIGALCLSCKHQDFSNMSGMFEDRELTEEGNTTPEGVSYGLSTGRPRIYPILSFIIFFNMNHWPLHCTALAKRLKKWSKRNSCRMSTQVWFLTWSTWAELPILSFNFIFQD